MKSLVDFFLIVIKYIFNWVLETQGDPCICKDPWTARSSIQSMLKEISPEYSLEDWCWSWNSNTLTTWYEVLTQLKRPWGWERLNAEGEGDNITHSMDMILSKLQESVMNRKGWSAVVHGVVKSWTQLSDWTELKYIFNYCFAVLSFIKCECLENSSALIIPVSLCQ